MEVEGKESTAYKYFNFHLPQFLKRRDISHCTICGRNISQGEHYYTTSDVKSRMELKDICIQAVKPTLLLRSDDDDHLQEELEGEGGEGFPFCDNEKCRDMTHNLKNLNMEFIATLRALLRVRLNLTRGVLTSFVKEEGQEEEIEVEELIQYWMKETGPAELFQDENGEDYLEDSASPFEVEVEGIDGNEDQEDEMEYEGTGGDEYVIIPDNVADLDIQPVVKIDRMEGVSIRNVQSLSGRRGRAMGKIKSERIMENQNESGSRYRDGDEEEPCSSSTVPLRRTRGKKLNVTRDVIDISDDDGVSKSLSDDHDSDPEYNPSEDEETSSVAQKRKRTNTIRGKPATTRPSGNIRRSNVQGLGASNKNGIRPPLLMKCPTCKVRVRNQRDLVVHAQFHAKERPYPCPSCKLAFRTASLLQRHKEYVHSKKKFACQICQKEFTAPEELRKHHTFIHDMYRSDSSNQCTLCGKVFLFPSTLNIHMQNVHKGEEPADAPVKDKPLPLPFCNICDERFQTAELLLAHAKEEQHSTKLKLFRENMKRKLEERIRQIREKTRANRIRISRNGRLKSKKPLKKPEVRSPKLCESCGKSYLSEAALKLHVERMHAEGAEGKFECNECNREFKFKCYLQRHIANVHKGIKRIRCRLCSEGFCNHTYLRKHMFNSHKEQFLANGEQFVCEQVCYMKFKTEEEFIEHMKDHEENCKCKVCGLMCKTPGKLQVHLKIHSTEREFKCKFCDKGFYCKSNLLEHERRHTGEKRFMCEHCAKGFNRQNELNRHLEHCANGEGDGGGHHRKPRSSALQIPSNDHGLQRSANQHPESQHFQPGFVERPVASFVMPGTSSGTYMWL